MKPKNGTVSGLRRMLAKSEKLRAELEAFVAAADDKFSLLSVGRQEGVYGRKLQSSRAEALVALQAFERLASSTARLADAMQEARP